jgi:CobQ-like glutamine amidotransferase family enzyme
MVNSYEWGSEGDGPGEFIHLHAVAIDRNNNVYVSDVRENERISKLTTDEDFITTGGSKDRSMDNSTNIMT